MAAGSKGVLAVVGGTGPTGTHIMSALARMGASVTAVSRRPSALASMSASLGFRPGDMSDRDSIRRATEGVDSLLLLTPRADNMDCDDAIEGAKNVVAAVNENGIRQFLYVSLIGCEAGPATSLFGTRYRVEEIIRTTTTAAAVIMRSGFFVDDWAVLHPFVLPGFRKGSRVCHSHKMPFSDRESLAQAIFAQLHDENSQDRVVQVRAPRLYTIRQIDKLYDEYATEGSLRAGRWYYLFWRYVFFARLQRRANPKFSMPEDTRERLTLLAEWPRVSLADIEDSSNVGERSKWTHSPIEERFSGMVPRPVAHLDAEKCFGDVFCPPSHFCPTRAITIRGSAYGDRRISQIDSSRCDGCGRCIKFCAEGALDCRSREAPEPGTNRC